MVTITGVLLENRESPRPAEGAILYLAEVIYSEEQGAPLIAGFDRKTSKSTQTDGNGRFVFTDVDPITYSIVLDRIYEAYLLADPNDGTDLLIEPVPGQIFDMGELVYASLPGFSPVP